MRDNRKQKTLIINDESSLPLDDELAALSRDVVLKLIFDKQLNNLRNEIGNKWKSDFSQLLIGIHTIKPEINISKLITDEEIINNQCFFEKCAKDYRNLAIRLINELANYFGVEINPENPLETFSFLKRHRQKSNGKINGWKYYFHGFHCGFKNVKSAREIEVPLVNGLEFGALDPYFFTRFIKLTNDYFNKIHLILIKPLQYFYITG